MIVEDFEDDADLLLRQLKRGGYEVTAERVDSPQAMAVALERDGWDVVIADYSLPQFNGLAALHMVRTKGLDVPFILVSGSIGEELAVAAMKAGADDYLMKGKLTRLVPVIKRELREVETRRARRRAEEELRQAHAQLEQRVEQRTQELLKANEALAVEIALRKQTEVELRRASEIAQAASEAAANGNRAKSEFLANMSHEIRTPMNAIMGYADVMLDPDQTVSDRLNCIQTIRRNAEHLLTIINDILDISKIEAGKLEVERIPCSPSQLVTDVLSLLRGRAYEKRLKLDVQFHAPFPEAIQSDPTRLRQILINLVGNAIKFTQTGGVRLEVKLLPAEKHLNPRLRFEVTDTGIGMSVDEVNRLFQPFTQADNSTTRRFGGTGLGLNICRRLAEMLGGDISAQSIEGNGSKFILTIDAGPLDNVRLLSEYVEAVAAVDQLAQSVPSRISGRILLVDDGADNRQLLSYYLTRAGAQVSTAENGKLACFMVLDAIVRQSPFDLIIMDMQMPELDGYGAASKLRSKGCITPIIALTAHAMADDRARCIRSGCTDYLSKPMQRSQLLEMAAKYLPKHSVAADPPAASTAVPVQPLQSSLSGEPELEQFLASFVASLPETVSRMRALLAEENMSPLREVLHQLKGTGGLFGFSRITDAATAAQQHIDQAGSLEQIVREVQSLIDLIRAVKDYDQRRELTR